MYETPISVKEQYKLILIADIGAVVESSSRRLCANSAARFPPHAPHIYKYMYCNTIHDRRIYYARVISLYWNAAGTRWFFFAAEQQRRIRISCSEHVDIEDEIRRSIFMPARLASWHIRRIRYVFAREYVLYTVWWWWWRTRRILSSCIPQTSV